MPLRVKNCTHGPSRPGALVHDHSRCILFSWSARKSGRSAPFLMDHYVSQARAYPVDQCFQPRSWNFPGHAHQGIPQAGVGETAEFPETDVAGDADHSASLGQRLAHQFIRAFFGHDPSAAQFLRPDAIEMAEVRRADAQVRVVGAEYRQPLPHAFFRKGEARLSRLTSRWPLSRIYATRPPKRPRQRARGSGRKPTTRTPAATSAQVQRVSRSQLRNRFQTLLFRSLIKGHLTRARRGVKTRPCLLQR